MPVRVKEVMNREVVTVDAGASLLEALAVMAEKSVKSLVVTPKSDSDAFGILTFTDIARKVIANDERLEMLNVFDIMTKPCITISAELDIRFAAKMLTELKISRLIVTNGSRLEGIVSLTDLVKSLMKKQT
ncbi:MAG: CBS domain-containing protein [Nitrospinae bacterium]|nr:CBS domain-containing protein [Nitrospinota bacterium]